MSANVVLEKLISIDETGMPVAPNVRQLQDKDVLMLWSRDTSNSKKKYLSEIGVVFYLGDPKSPPRQQGKSDAECLKDAIENYNLDVNYKPDVVVKRLIDKYYIQNVTEAGIALEALKKSVHLVSIAATKINEQLNKKLADVIDDDSITSVLTLMDAVSKRVVEIPNLVKALGTAYENLRNEEEDSFARGGGKVLSSMDADEDY